MSGSLRVVSNPTGINGGGPSYSDEFREWCFELYAIECNRNLAAVHRRITEDYLPSDPEVHPEITYQTIKRWSRRYNWDQRFLDDFRKIHHHLYEKTVASLGMAAEQAVQSLVEIMTNPHAMDVARVQAAREILGRAGHMEHRRNKDDSKPDGPAKVYEMSAAGLSTEELLERINERTRRTIEAEASDLIDVESAG